MFEKIVLSPSKLSLLKECPRCFYDANILDIARPRGIFPSLPGGMDLIMKKFTDQYRGGLPHVLKGRVPGVLYPDLVQMKKWRFWRTAPRYFDPELNLEIYMAIDDLLVDGEFVIPIDFKTKGSEPKDDGSQYYQLQMDIYNLGFQYAGFKVREEAYLIYVYPDAVHEQVALGEGVYLDIGFSLKVYKLQCSIERAKETLKKACEVLRGSRPPANPDCEMCLFLEKQKGII